MRHKQIGSALCHHSSKCIGIGFAQVRNEQFSKKVTWTTTPMRHTTNDLSGFFSVRRRKIRAHRMKSDSLGFNFLAVKRRRCDYRNVTAFLQLKRKRHEWMEVTKRSPSGKNHSSLCAEL